MIQKSKLFKTVLSDDFSDMWLCLGVRPVYRYEGQVRTSEVIGVYYRCLHPQSPGEGPYDIKVLGQGAVVAEDEISMSTFLQFSGLEFVSWTDRRTGASRISGRASQAVRADRSA